MTALLAWLSIRLTAWGWLPHSMGKRLFLSNAAILAVNLLPALPLDGGRLLSLLLGYLFSYKLKWLPTYGLDSWACYILPVVCLSFNPIAYIVRQIRSSMLEAMEQDYVRTARAKGVSEFFVVVKHALKNAIMPVVTYLGPLVAGLLTGSFIVERLFSISGIGRYFVDSISNRDYTMIMGITIFFGIFVVVCNLVVDILQAIIDPRVKLDAK